MRPEWCPQDVWEEAIKVQYQEPGLCLANSQVEPTARAILAERERVDDLEQIIADQMAQIEELRADLASTEADLAMAEEPDPYWQGVYDRIRAAWDKWALAELGTASPSPLDLEGRPELAELWEAVR